MSAPALHIVTTVPQSLSTLLAGQPRRLARSFAVTLVSSPGPELGAAGMRESVDTMAMAMTRRLSPLADLRALGQLYRHFRSTRPAIVQSYTPKAGLLAMTAARLARVPIRVHGIVGMPLMEARGWRRALLGCTERATYAMATDLTCNSYGLRAWVSERLRPRQEITVVAQGSINGVDVEQFAPASAEVRRAQRDRLGISEGATVYIFLGRLVRAKGVGELLQAFDALQQRGADVVLLLVGDQEPDLDPLSHETEARLAAGRGIVRQEWVEDVRPALAAADVCVLPSYREGLPNSLLEAAACGLAVVASQINGCDEIVEHGRTGLLVPPKDADALQQALAQMLDVDTRSAMGRAGRRRVVERYDHQSFCRELDAYYGRLSTSAQVPLDGLAETDGERDRTDAREQLS